MVQGNRLQSFILRRPGELCHPVVVYVINPLYLRGSVRLIYNDCVNYGLHSGPYLRKRGRIYRVAESKWINNVVLFGRHLLPSSPRSS
jgi:hypothetical protein